MRTAQTARRSVVSSNGCGNVRGAAVRERTTVEAILAVRSLYGRWPAPDGAR